jgi:SAM-dependent methyltransferase
VTGQEPLSSDLYDESYYLTACEGYDEFIAGEGEHLSRRMRAAFTLAAVEPGMRVLDVGCGRGEIVHRCALLGADAFGIDFAAVAVRLSRRLTANLREGAGVTGVLQGDAKRLPFVSGTFDRALMFDIVEHLRPWELHQAMTEVHRVLTPEGRLIVHTAPNVWYDRYAYPVVRLIRRLQGRGALYPSNPRAFLVPENLYVHVNEQSMLSLRRALRRAGFSGRVWLDSPPQNRQESAMMAALRRVAFNWPPFRWFFERELFAVASKV